MTDVSFLHLFFPEGNGAGSGIHGLDDGKRLQPIAQIAHPIAAILEALFHTLCAKYGIWHDNDRIFHWLSRLEEPEQLRFWEQEAI